MFHRRERFERVESDTFWLSTEETKPVRGWDAALPRVVTWVRLRERTTGRELFCFNTHFDHLGRQARIESAHLLRRKIAGIAGESPVVLMGDFNCGISSKPYKILTAGGLRDAARVSQHPPHGPRKTWRGLAGLLGSTIDFIFVRGAITVSQYAVLSDEWDRRVASDHRPVVADIHLDS